MAEPALALERLRSSLPQDLVREITSARDLLRAREAVHKEAPFLTSLPALDRVLGGGLERGALTEILGNRSSGRFSAVLAILATATAGGEAAALVDLDGNLDPQGAEAAGCALERLLWVRPERMREALYATELLLGAGFPLVVLDLGTPPIPGGRGADAAWLRLARAAATQRSVFLVAAPYRVSGTAAHAVVAARCWQAQWRGEGRAPRLLLGIDSAWVLERSRHLRPLRPGATPAEERCRFRVPTLWPV
jgi:recA bacterial DNA recombination protein